MKIYLINLDKDTDKLAFVDEQLKRLGIKYTRVPGVYGKGLPKNEYRAAYNAFRWWCAEGHPIAPAEIGCALSHYKIYQGMKPGEVICILEDDVLIREEFAERLDEIERFVDATKPQVVMLSSHERKRDGIGIVPSTIAMCTDGYVLTYEAARVLLKENLPLRVTCDTWKRWVRMGLIELYHALPSVICQDQKRFGTSTQAGVTPVWELPFHRKVIHKMKRLVGISIDSFLTLIGH